MVTATLDCGWRWYGQTTVVTERLGWLSWNASFGRKIFGAYVHRQGGREMEDRVDRLLPFGYSGDVDLPFHNLVNAC